MKETWEDFRKYLYFILVFSSFRAVLFTGLAFVVITSRSSLPIWTVIPAMLASSAFEAFFQGKYCFPALSAYGKSLDSTNAREVSKRRVFAFMLSMFLRQILREISSAVMVTGLVTLVLSFVYQPFPAWVSFLLVPAGLGLWWLNTIFTRQLDMRRLRRRATQEA